MADDDKVTVIHFQMENFADLAESIMNSHKAALYIQLTAQV